jgi:hypothetical protein
MRHAAHRDLIRALQRSSGSFRDESVHSRLDSMNRNPGGGDRGFARMLVAEAARNAIRRRRESGELRISQPIPVARNRREAPRFITALKRQPAGAELRRQRKRRVPMRIGIQSHLDRRGMHVPRFPLSAAVVLKLAVRHSISLLREVWRTTGKIGPGANKSGKIAPAEVPSPPRVAKSRCTDL